MEEYNCDLHIHGRYSVASSKKIDFNSLSIAAKKKGLHCLGTGDILQKNWLSEAESLFKKSTSGYFYKDIFFILQTEIECAESIHHLVFLPDFSSVYELRKILAPFVKKLDGNLSGRIHVSLSPEELVEKIVSVNGLIGPAHAFTPFKSIFRWGKYDKLEQCYGSCTKHIKFLELGLSADTIMAEQLNSISKITFLSNSDAHSDSLNALGREFNRILCETPNFDEISDAICFRNQRKIVCNAGLDPKMGKYYSIFCNKCRRRVKFQTSDKNLSKNNDFIFDDQFLTFFFESETLLNQKKEEILNAKVMCPICFNEHIEKLGKKTQKGSESLLTKIEERNREIKESKSNKPLQSLLIRPGVSERVSELSKIDPIIEKQTRPPYFHILPLITIISFANELKNLESKANRMIYDKIIEKYGSEIGILLDLPEAQWINEDDKELKKIFEIILAMRKNELNYESGGGGTFGHLMGFMNYD